MAPRPLSPSSIYGRPLVLPDEDGVQHRVTIQRELLRKGQVRFTVFDDQKPAPESYVVKPHDAAKNLRPDVNKPPFPIPKYGERGAVVMVGNSSDLYSDPVRIAVQLLTAHDVCRADDRGVPAVFLGEHEYGKAVNQTGQGMVIVDSESIIFRLDENRDRKNDELIFFQALKRRDWLRSLLGQLGLGQHFLVECTWSIPYQIWRPTAESMKQYQEIGNTSKFVKTFSFSVVSYLISMIYDLYFVVDPANQFAKTFFDKFDSLLPEVARDEYRENVLGPLTRFHQLKDTQPHEANYELLTSKRNLHRMSVYVLCEINILLALGLVGLREGRNRLVYPFQVAFPQEGIVREILRGIPKSDFWENSLAAGKSSVKDIFANKYGLPDFSCRIQNDLGVFFVRKE